MSTVTKNAGEQRIVDAFSAVEGAALMPYMMGGYPNLEASKQIAEAYIEGGADLIELGVPYSDPLADGPVVHAAGTVALSEGIKVADILGIAKGISDRVPVVLMVYVNILLNAGLENFLKSLNDAGISGLIIPDVSIGEESEEIVTACRNAGIAFVPLIAPTTVPERAKDVAGAANGFLYAVSVTGTTGERESAESRFESVVEQAKRFSNAPVAVGFGISDGAQAAKAVAAGAEGVIVGSRLVRAAGTEKPLEEISSVMADLASGLGRNR